jgi:flagellar hook-associated protein 3 FlgL
MSVGRITNLMTSSSVLVQINNAESQLDTTEEELSSGLSINEPSDNPVGAGLSATLTAQLSEYTAYTQNASIAGSWNSAASTGMTSLQDDISRVQELVTEAGNGTENSTDLADISDEITQIQQSIQSTLNTQYNGQGVFTGTSANNPAVSMTISPGTSVTVTADLTDLINGTGSGSTATTGLLTTISQIQSDLASGNTSGLTGSDLTNLSANLSSLEGSQVQVGTVEDQIQMASTSLTTLQTSTTTELSNDQEVNMATAETDYNNEEAAFQAALQAGSSIVQESLMNFLSN